MASYFGAAPQQLPTGLGAGAQRALAASSLKDFDIIQPLGKGSYGSVHKAKRKADGFEYAIKEVNIRKLNTREREDALNEIRILASIRHKNIIRYCDAFVERDNLYIVMEFAEHGDVGRQIEKFKKANKYIKEDTVWSYAIQIAQGLLSLHDKNVLHRDIKPKNVFLTGKAHVRLGDLGCAKLMKGGLARTQIGTPYYMSPEIWANHMYDAKSDMWALGCLLFELAQFDPPFLANDMPGLSSAVRNIAPRRISKHYSDDLAGMVAMLLEKDPRKRPTAREFLSLPGVASRMHFAPADEDSPISPQARPGAGLIATIKVPYGFGVPGLYGAGSFGGAGAYGAAQPRLNLPAPSYPSRPASRPASPSRAEDREAAKDANTSAVNTSAAAAAPVAANAGVVQIPASAALPSARAAPPAPVAAGLGVVSEGVPAAVAARKPVAMPAAPVAPSGGSNMMMLPPSLAGIRYAAPGAAAPRSLAVPPIGAANMPPPPAAKPAAPVAPSAGPTRLALNYGLGLAPSSAVNAPSAGGAAGGMKGLMSGFGNLRLGGGGAPLAPVPEGKALGGMQPSAAQAAVDAARAQQARRQVSVAGMVAAAGGAMPPPPVVSRLGVGLGGAAGAYLGSRPAVPTGAAPAPVARPW